MAVFGFGCTSNLIRGRTYGEAVALCLPGVMYSPNFWFTRQQYLNFVKYSNPLTFFLPRYPQKVSPWLNLVKLMTPTSWAWTLASLVSVVLCFNGISLLVRRFMAIRLRTVEIDLYPLRFTFYFMFMLSTFLCILEFIFLVKKPGQARPVFRTEPTCIHLTCCGCCGLFVEDSSSLTSFSATI